MAKYCPDCNAFLPDDTNFCPTCGHDFSKPPRYEASKYSYNAYNNNAFDPSGPEGKCRGIAALLAIIIGALGIHYFYCGKSTAGILTILLSLCTCGIWTTIMFAQGIYMLCITNDEFEHKYVATPSTFPVF